jgi:ankyrin repeat protein
VNTAIGALSNISLDQNLKVYVGQAAYIERLLSVINTHMKNRSIASTAAGLLANLAVNHLIADVLVDSGVINTITNMLKLNSLEPTFQRNTAAALSNVITSILFTRECLKNKTIEHLFDLQENATTMGVVALIMNCFNALDVNSERRTTSFHMMAHHGMYNLLNRELLENLCNESFDINFLDENEATLLHYAIQREHRKLISLLIVCGSDYKSICRENEINSELSIDERARRRLEITNFSPTELSISRHVLESIEKTEFNIFCATRRYKKLISCSFWNLPEDLSKIICSFVLPYDMLIETIDFY